MSSGLFLITVSESSSHDTPRESFPLAYESFAIHEKILSFSDFEIDFAPQTML